MKLDFISLQNESYRFKEKLIKEVISIKFLDLEIDKHMNWRNHIVHTCMLPKLSSACYAIRCRYNFTNIERIKIIYYSYFHWIMNYGIVFWG